METRIQQKNGMRPEQKTATSRTIADVSLSLSISVRMNVFCNSESTVPLWKAQTAIKNM